MLLADEYAPTRGIVGSIVFAVLVGILGVVLYVRPGVGWAMARARVSRDNIEAAKCEPGAATERVFPLHGLILAALIIIAISIGYAVT